MMATEALLTIVVLVLHRGGILGQDTPVEVVGNVVGGSVERLLAGKPLGGNILLCIADDLGTDKVAAYGEHPMPPHTPNIDRLASEGVLFRNAYAAPSCSPTRAALLTGRFGRCFGLGRYFNPEIGSYELPLSAVTLPEVLDRSEAFDYAHSLVGKWHLGSFRYGAGIDHPLASGFDFYAGPFANLSRAENTDRRKHNDYYHWEKVAGGETHVVEAYATTDTTNDAVARMKAMPEPWFLWVAFNAPHAPLDIPPKDLVPRKLTKRDPDAIRYAAIVEALDSEIGRLLASLSPEVRARTTVIFLGDNGTPGNAITEPRNSSHGKGTVFEGGINVPFIVTGPAVTQPGSESAALVQVQDVFATAADIAGVPLASLAGPKGETIVYDAVSLLPHLIDPTAPSQREFLFAEYFLPTGKPPYQDEGRAIRDGRFKLVQFGGKQLLFDLEGRFDDGPNLLTGTLEPEQAEAKARLEAELARRVSTLGYTGF